MMALEALAREAFEARSLLASKDARIADLERQLEEARNTGLWHEHNWRQERDLKVLAIEHCKAAEQSALTAKRDGMIEAAGIAMLSLGNDHPIVRAIRTRAASLTGEGAAKEDRADALADIMNLSFGPPGGRPAYRDKRRWMMEWQPIETAPKDGTHILCCDEAGAIYRAAFDEECEAWGAMCGQPVVYTPEPTRWMPLPDDTDAAP